MSRILIFFFIVLASALSAQSKQTRPIINQSKQISIAVSKIEAMKDADPITVSIVLDVSNSLGIDQKTLTKSLGRRLDKELKKPGDRICVVFVGDNSAKLSNQVCFELNLSYPDFSSVSDDEVLLERVVLFRSTLKSKKRSMIRSILKRYITVSADRDQTQILEAMYPLSQVLKEPSIVIFITDMLQFSSLRSAYDIPSSIPTARVLGRKDAQMLVSEFAISKSSLANASYIEFWIPGGVYSKQISQPYLEAYWQSVISNLGFTKQVQFKAGII